LVSLRIAGFAPFTGEIFVDGSSEGKGFSAFRNTPTELESHYVV
jgi:hypothetical protein